VLAKPKSRKAIDLSDYTGDRAGALSRYGFYAVYVISYGENAPRKIGFARDPAARLATLQTGHPEKLRVEYLLWTPTHSVASLIERRVHAALKKAGARVSGEWFRITLFAASETIRRGAEKLYPSIEFCDHEQMIALLDSDGFGKKPASDYSDQERNFLVRAMAADPGSPVLPKLGIHVWAELITPMTRSRVVRHAA
jgi:hypothetical protein